MATVEIDENTTAPLLRHSLIDLLASPLACALINEENGVIEAASAAWSDLLPDAIGSHLSEVLHFTEKESSVDVTASQNADCGAYRKLTGEFVPVVVEYLKISENDHCCLAVMLNGGPFRDAEAGRLNNAPYAVLRITREGKLSLVNPAGKLLLGLDANYDGIGFDFIAAFTDATAEKIGRAFRDCINDAKPSLVKDVFVRAAEETKGPMYLAMMPDVAPGKIVLGVFAVFGSTVNDVCRNKLKQIALESGHWSSRLDRCLEIIRRFIPYDRAAFGLYSNAAKLYRPLHVTPSEPPWPQLWIPLRPGIDEWLKSGITWEDDLDEFVRLYPGLEEDEIVQLYKRDHMHAFVVLPVFGPKGVIASLSLSSRQKAAYNQDTLSRLEDLDVTQILLLFERESEEERREIIEQTGSAIRTAGSLTRAADHIVSGLKALFNCSHVSIMTVDEEAQQFRLLRQAYDKFCELPPGFQQNITEGMLRETLQTNKTRQGGDVIALTIEDTRERPRKFNYNPVNDRLLSAMQYPMSLNGEIRWIIELASTRASAFREPDIQIIKAVASELEAEVDRLYRSAVNDALLSKMSEAVVIVGTGNIILRTNQAADQLLSRKADQRGGALTDYASDASNAEIIRSNEPVASNRLSLIDHEGQLHTVLATRTRLPEGYNASVWFFTDIAVFDWNVEFRYLQTVVTEVAQQTRGPLTIASALLSRLLTSVADTIDVPMVRGATEQAIQEIGRTDITFERLADGLAALKTPIRERSDVNLSACISEVISELPRRDQAHIALLNNGAGIVISGDPGRLRFVFRSILAYLLRCRPDNTKNDVKIEIKPDARILFEIPELLKSVESKDRAIDPLLEAVNVAQDDAGIALPVIDQIISAHGGSLIANHVEVGASNPKSIWFSFEIELLSSAGGGTQ